MRRNAGFRELGFVDHYPKFCTPRPERGLSTKCSLFPSCRGLVPPISATKRPYLPICHQTQILYTPPAWKGRSVLAGTYRGAHVSAPMSSYVQRLDRSHWKGYAREPPGLGRATGPGNARTRERRDETRQRTEPTGELPGDGGAGIASVLRRGA